MQSKRAINCYGHLLFSRIIVLEDNWRISDLNGRFLHLEGKGVVGPHKKVKKVRSQK